MKSAMHLREMPKIQRAVEKARDKAIEVGSSTLGVSICSHMYRYV